MPRTSTGPLLDACERFGVMEIVKEGARKLAAHRRLSAESEEERVLLILSRYTFFWTTWTTRRAGCCKYGVKEIELHADLAKPGREAYRNRTFLHEVAHAVAFALYNDNAHGRMWQLVMRAFGLPPERCHAYKFETLGQRKVQVVGTCARCNSKLERPTRLDPRRNYTHTRCGGRVIPVS